ncbi:MAG TPA: DUF2891 domain-containing protein [Caulobacteraceae bacterium]|jgi:hypothetical protein
MSDLDPDLAARLAAIALGHVARPWPYAPGHVVTGPDDLAAPQVHHPVFFGSFDWHSCVHGHWLLARLIHLYPDMEGAPAVRAHFDAAFTAQNIAAEAAYFERPAAAGFERPYGWAWLLKLAAELRAGGAQSRAWDHALRPLAGVIVRRFLRFLPKADYPVRAGVHSNTAFALALAHDYALVAADDGLRDMAVAKARAWYGHDAACQAWEPSGDDFLSPALMEAELMRRVVDAEAFRPWFHAFLPGAAAQEPAGLFTPAKVSDRTDGKIAHLDGLNLSRAWCWRGIASALAEDDPVRAVALAAAGRHLAAGLPHLAADYAGEHWLASFALLALEGA